MSFSIYKSSFFIKENKLITGWSNKIIDSEIKKIESTDSNYPALGKYYSFPLSEQLYAYYPLAIDALPSQTEELNMLIKESKVKWKNDFFISPYYRIANAIINDAYIQHFYAYYEEDGLADSWQSVCSSYIKEIADCTSYEEYSIYSYKHYASVRDGHMYIMNGYNKPGSMLGKYVRIYYPDILLKYVEGKVCIADYSSTYKDLQPGDQIVAVNGKDIKSLLEEKLKLVSASTKGSSFEKVCNMFIFQSFKKDSIIHIQVKQDGNITRDMALRTNKTQNREFNQGEFIKQIEDGIWKINPCTDKKNSYSAFAKYIDEFQHAKGIIIDVRGYPQASILPILSHFIDTTAAVGQILTPTFYYPNHDNVKYEITALSSWGIHPAIEPYQKEWEYDKPLPVRLQTPVVFLTDHNAISFAETIMELFKSHGIGTIIGQPTAGTNGDAVIVRSPTIGMIFTGYKFLTFGGERHHGVGVRPDIECPFRMEDLKNQEDTHIKKACEWINSKYD